jgi:FKBP-type peptidyl-prolyl cis-trans isomerase
MLRPSRFLFAFLVAAVSLACGGERGAAPDSEGAAPAAGSEAFASEDEKTAYAIGLALARDLGSFAFSDAELDRLIEGLRDTARGRAPKVDLDDEMPRIQALRETRMAAAAAVEGKASEAFVAAAASEPGAEKLASGLVYRELSPGSGASPAASDTVRVHYHGTLRDGVVFDSSRERGTPAQFPLDRVIPCWGEGMQRMKVGGKSKLVCPADIAYGDRGAPPRIAPGAALAFEVELIEIVAADAAGPGVDLPRGHP